MDTRRDPLKGLVNAMQVTSLNELSGAFRGELYPRGTEGYDGTCFSWNVAIELKPDLAIVAANEQDVAEAVRFARQNGMSVTTHVTGHGQPDGIHSGVLIHLGKLTSVAIDSERRTARVGGGACWKDVIEAAHPHGLAPVCGSAPHVGVAGYTVGGGYGITSRAHGLGADQVLSMRVVTADGQVRTASPDENSDLFFATLGGGGGFGVITELEIQLHAVAELYAGSTMFDASLAEEVLIAFGEWCETVPNEVSGALHIMTFPPAPFIPEFLHGKSKAIFIGSAIGMSPDQAREYFAPMRERPGAEFDSFRPMPFSECGSIYQDPVQPLPVCGSGSLLRELNPETIATFLEALGPIPESPSLLIQIRQLGGAITTNGDPRSTIRRNRQAKFFAFFLGVPMPHNPRSAILAHARSVFEAIAPWLVCRGPLNFVVDEPAQVAEQVFAPEELAQVRQAKAAYDPDNLFCNAGLIR